MKSLFKPLYLFLSLLLLFYCTSTDGEKPGTEEGYFTNPILVDGPDPYVYLHSDGFYYCMVTRGDRLTLWKSKDFTNLGNLESGDIWFPPDTGRNTCCIWAPEIHFLDGQWFIYYSATDQERPTDLHRHVYVLRNRSENPFDDSWEDLGLVETRYPGIDGHVFEYKGIRYFAYSPYIANQSGINLARMTSETTLADEINLGLPIYNWEKTPPREILEGPQFLEGPGEMVFIVYSAGACWDDNYGLGMLSAKKDADLLDPDSWERINYQVFEQCPDSSVFGPGHNCFTKSPDLTQDWIVYHAKRESSNECTKRSMRAQRINWDDNGWPQFGMPVALGSHWPLPSGTNDK